MGLDSVELVLAIEEKFGISIPDEEACAIRTVGDMHRCVMSKLAMSDKSTCLTQKAFHLLRRNISAQFGIARRSFRPNTPLASIIPRAGRREQWRQLQRELGATRWPHLSVSKLGGVALLLTVLGLPIFVSWYGATVLGWSTWVKWLAGITTFLLAARCSRYYMRPFMTEFGPGITSVRDLALTLVAENPQLLGTEQPAWTEAEVYSLLSSVIKQQTGVTEFSKESRIVDDLGID